MADLFRFEGFGTHSDRSSNTCVAPGFACGWQPKRSAIFDKCTRPVDPESSPFFVDSADCFPGLPGPHFYLAGRIVKCPAGICSGEWGLMDIVEAPATPGPASDQAFLKFRLEWTAAL